MQLAARTPFFQYSPSHELVALGERSVDKRGGQSFFRLRFHSTLGCSTSRALVLAGASIRDVWDLLVDASVSRETLGSNCQFVLARSAAYILRAAPVRFVAWCGPQQGADDSIVSGLG